MILLGIESSCDETAIAIMSSDQILAHSIHSQIALHREWGGVVPELASRDHVLRLMPLLQESLAAAEIELSDIDAYAYTAGPGLIGSLLMGATTACTLAASYNKPVYPVHHLEGHIVSALIDNFDQFPAIVLLVSGGHSMFLVAHSAGSYELIGQSVDDAVGECFDKVAKLMGLGYPGGPVIEALALKGDSTRWQLPRPMLHSKSADMSFSGLKTAVLQAWQQLDQPSEQDRADMAASFQEAVSDVLLAKMRYVTSLYNINTVMMVGGVAANSYIRTTQTDFLNSINRNLLFPRKELCTDNGVMIAKAGLLRISSGKSLAVGEIMVKPRWTLADYLANHW